MTSKRFQRSNYGAATRAELESARAEAQSHADQPERLAAALQDQSTQLQEQAAELEEQLAESQTMAEELELANQELVEAQERARTAVAEEAAIVETLHRIGTALAGELDLQTIVQTATDESTRLTGAEFGAFFYNLVNEAGESYTFYTLSGVPREAFSRFPMPRNTQVFSPTFHGEGVVRSDDILHDRTCRPTSVRRREPWLAPDGSLPLVSLAIACVCHVTLLDRLLARKVALRFASVEATAPELLGRLSIVKRSAPGQSRFRYGRRLADSNLAKSLRLDDIGSEDTLLFPSTLILLLLDDLLHQLPDDS